MLAESWAVAAEFAVDHGGKHCFDVGRVAGLLAKKLRFDESHCSLIELASRLHDIGKVVLGSVAIKAIKLKCLDEHVVVREHALAGHKLLVSFADPVLALAAKIARSHHERWNGCGYPDGLSGDEIPIEARICAVADAYVSLARPELPLAPWDDLSIEKQLLSMAGFQLDPNVVTALVSEIKHFKLADATGGGGHLRNGLAMAKSNLFNSIGTDVYS